MSKIGKKPVAIPQGVSVEALEGKVMVTGPKGTITRTCPREINVEVQDGQVVVSMKMKTKQASALFGTTRAHIANMVNGVTNGWNKVLELVGTGYRAELRGTKLVLAIGFSHPVEFDAPEGITFKVEKSDITIDGVDKDLVGLMAARIRAVRPPEPYKGKGIKYKDEIVRRKAGKAAKTAA